MNSLRRYKNEVWLLMHRDSDKQDTQTAALRLYLDESGDESPGTPHSVLGGLLIYRPAFELFEDEWDSMLVDHGISDGLHMKEFGRPHGKCAGMSDCCRRELFIEACQVIRKYRAMIVASTLSNDEYRAYMPEIARQQYSVYAMGFSMMVAMNHGMAKSNNYADPIPIIMDTGNSKKGQITKIHEFLQKKLQKVEYLHLGSLTFDDDKNWGMLQAADLIAWGTRRKVSKIPFGLGFGPIEDLLSSGDPYHTEISWKEEWLSNLGNVLAEGISRGEGFDEPTGEEIGEHYDGKRSI